MKMPWYSVFSFWKNNGSCLKTTVEKYTWMRTISVLVIAITSKVSFWKLLNISYLQSSFSTIIRCYDNGIWRTPCSWRFDGSTYVLILSWVDITKRKWEVPWKLLVAQKSESVHCSTLHHVISLNIAFFFFSQTNLVFKFNIVLIK